MSLPVIQTPTYEVKLVSQPKPVVFRPYVVKEEKLLLMAQQGNDPKEVDRAVKQVITNCTFGKLDISRVPSFDVEYMFLQLRARSVNNIIEVKFECQNAVNPPTEKHDGRCHNVVDVNINIDDIKIVVPDGHTPKIQLTDDIGIVMRYPTGESFDTIVNNLPEDITEILSKCIDKIYLKDGTVFEMSEQPIDELQTFIDSLTIPHVEKIREFFDTMPRLSYSFVFTCSKCGYTEDVTLMGLMDFFG